MGRGRLRRLRRGRHPRSTVRAAAPRFALRCACSRVFFLRLRAVTAVAVLSLGTRCVQLRDLASAWSDEFIIYMHRQPVAQQSAGLIPVANATHPLPPQPHPSHSKGGLDVGRRAAPAVHGAGRHPAGVLGALPRNRAAARAVPAAPPERHERAAGRRGAGDAAAGAVRGDVAADARPAARGARGPRACGCKAGRETTLTCCLQVSSILQPHCLTFCNSVATPHTYMRPRAPLTRRRAC